MRFLLKIQLNVFFKIVLRLQFLFSFFLPFVGFFSTLYDLPE